MNEIEGVRCPQCGQNGKLYVIGLAWQVFQASFDAVACFLVGIG